METVTVDSDTTCCPTNGDGTEALAEAQRLLDADRQQRIAEFGKEVEKLCEKYGVSLDVESRIVVVPRGPNG